MSRRSPIPSIPLGLDPAGLLAALKENVEVITGRRRGMPPIEQLDTAATTAEIIDKVNEILTRLQGD